jgi:hypothetical protein
MGAKYMGAIRTLTVSIFLILLVGWLSIAGYSSINTETPSDFRIYEIKNGGDKPSPSDHIKEHQIHVYKNRIIIDIENAAWARFTDTNSMDPVIDIRSNSIEISPKDPDDIQLGDIISYKSNYADGIIIHRVVLIGYDEKGWYAILQGDNLEKPDPGKIRFDQILGVVVGIIY